MTQQTEQDTLVSLRDYMEARLNAMDRATEVARASMDKRLDGMNEFRNALKDQSGQMVTRAEMDLKIGPIIKDIADLNNFKASHEGKASQISVIISLGIGLLGLALGGAALILHK